MEEIGRLNEAFRRFTEASQSLETSYARLQERVRYLTQEVEEKNRQLEAALRDTERVSDYLRCVLQSMGEAIIVLDTGRNVTMINRAAEDILELDAEGAVGRSLEDLELSVERDGSDTLIRTRGRTRHVIISCAEVLDSGGVVRGYVVVIQDITRLRELESQQERNHRLIAMGEMAAKIVHEVRSPLCSIELYATMLAKDLEGTGHLRLAQGISSGIGSLNSILTNMLFFAKPQKAQFREVLLSAVLGDALFILRPMAETHGITVQVDAPDDARVQGDQELLKQVALNILMNAVQATPRGGRITITVREDDDGTSLSVLDEGEGIEAENRERIFDPFFSTKEKGTGLGLPIASKIMQAHGGMIIVKSGTGSGTCFELRFPVSAGEGVEAGRTGGGIFR